MSIEPAVPTLLKWSEVAITFSRVDQWTSFSELGRFPLVLKPITKWIEVKPVTCPKADRVLEFLDELVHHYGLPHHIIIDLGSNFNNHEFWEYCKNSGIDV
jgi:hypothetical protein